MSLLRTFLSVSSITFLSRLMGLWRDIIIAQVFGAGAVSDAFFAAFRLPNMLRRFTAEGALTQAFVPVYGKQRQADRLSATLIAREILTLLTVFMLLLTMLGGLLAPWIIRALAPGLTEAALASDLFRIVFPYILFISLVALFAGMLSTINQFAAAAAAPLILNMAMILSALWWAPMFERPIFALAWGVFGGGLLQLAWIIVFAYRAGLPILPAALRKPSANAIRVLRLLWRGAIGAGAAQINLLINLFIASFLTAGSISWLYYADRLMELPVGLLGATIAIVVLPKLSITARDTAAFSRLLDTALQLIVFLAIPAAAGLAMLALPLIASLFMYGAFTVADTRMTQQAVLAYSIGIIGLTTVRPLAAAFFAKQDASIPVRAAVGALVATQLLNLLFIFLLDFGHAGLALSVGLAACLNAGVLFAVLRRRQWYVPNAGWGKFIGKITLALAAMLLVLVWLTPPDDYWLSAPPLARLSSLALCVLAAATTYFAVAAGLGIRPHHFQTPPA